MANFQRDKRETLFKSASDTISGKRQKTSEARHQSWGYYCILTSSLGWLTMHFSSSSKTEMWWPSWMQFKYRMKGASKLFSLWAKMRFKTKSPHLFYLLQKINHEIGDQTETRPMLLQMRPMLLQMRRMVVWWFGDVWSRPLQLLDVQRPMLLTIRSGPVQDEPRQLKWPRPLKATKKSKIMKSGKKLRTAKCSYNYSCLHLELCVF